MGKLGRSKTPRTALVVSSILLFLLVIAISYECDPLQQYLSSGHWPQSQQETAQKASRQLSNLSTATTNGLESGNQPVLNLHPFSFNLNHPDKCKNEDVFLLIIVTTTPQHHRQRQAIRQTWGNEANIPGVVIKTVFAVGLSDNMEIQRALEDENDAHGDVIQENFVDTPRNSTLKTVMCLKWASQFCPNAKYVLKIVPDTFVNIFSLVKKSLKELHSTDSQKLLMGRVYKNTEAVRDPHGEWKQWYVAKEEFPRDTFPPYAGGFAYVMSNDMPKLLYEASLSTKYLFMEDIYIGLCLEKLGIAPRHHSGFCSWHVEIDSCKFDWLMVSRKVGNPEKMVKYWKALTSKC